MLGDRPLSRVLKEIYSPRNYAALWRMFRLTSAFRENAGRYLFGRGSYPYVCEIRTPTGVVAPALYTQHDMWTINEIFFRQDYLAGPDLGVVVDIGSNIGISALYFLSRNRTSRCYLYEPDPRNIEKLTANLAGYQDRIELHEVAVAPTSGEADFGTEPTGRYGGIGVATAESIRVRCLGINEALDEVIEQEGSIDLLKLDIEGLEAPTVAAVRRDLLERIPTIYYESSHPEPLHPELFDHVFYNETCRLTRRTTLGGRD